jgi:arylsulfatase A-like enzyme
MRTIVFALRGCPVGCLGGYGNEWIVTPNLDRLAAEGVVFDRHISDCPDPDAAERAWLTGRHQMPPPNAERSVPVCRPVEAEPLLLPALREAGVRTTVVRANHPETDAPASFYAGWDEVFDARPRAGDNSPLDALVDSFPSLLDRLGTVPRWLIWIEIDRLLPPWSVSQEVFDAYVGDAEEPAEGSSEDESDDEPPGETEDESDDEPPGETGSEEDDPVDEEPMTEDADDDGPVVPFADPPTGLFDRSDLAAWEWLHRTFAAVVTALDAELGRLFDELRPRGLDQTAAWVVTSDLGYPLGEHGQVGLFRPWLHEELVHVPLLLRLPGAAEAGRRVPAFTQPADLAPTLLDLFGIEPPAGPDRGHSLIPLARGGVESVRSAACTGLDLDGVAEWAVRTDRWALLLPGGAQPEGDPPRGPLLFEKPDDRWEVNNLGTREAGIVEELTAVLGTGTAAGR